MKSFSSLSVLTSFTHSWTFQLHFFNLFPFPRTTEVISAFVQLFKCSTFFISHIHHPVNRIIQSTVREAPQPAEQTLILEELLKWIIAQQQLGPSF